MLLAGSPCCSTVLWARMSARSRALHGSTYRGKDGAALRRGEQAAPGCRSWPAARLQVHSQMQPRNCTPVHSIVRLTGLFVKFRVSCCARDALTADSGSAAYRTHGCSSHIVLPCSLTSQLTRQLLYTIYMLGHMLTVVCNLWLLTAGSDVPAQEPCDSHADWCGDTIPQAGAAHQDAAQCQGLCRSAGEGSRRDTVLLHMLRAWHATGAVAYTIPRHGKCHLGGVGRRWWWPWVMVGVDTA